MPADTPISAPVPALTVAILVGADIHVPPLVASVNVALAPAHTDNVPAVAGTAGKGFTVTAVVLLHPVMGLV